MRSIDGDKLKRKAQECATEAWKMNLTARIETVLNQFIDWIDKAPTVESEIVRCKDCKHRPIRKNGFVLPPNDDDEKCPFLCDDYFYSRRPGDNFFCANAERTAE